MLNKHDSVVHSLVFIEITTTRRLNHVLEGKPKTLRMHSFELVFPLKPKLNEWTSTGKTVVTAHADRDYIARALTDVLTLCVTHCTVLD